jgi:hypothetical protein
MTQTKQMYKLEAEHLRDIAQLWSSDLGLLEVLREIGAPLADPKINVMGYALVPDHKYFHDIKNFLTEDEDAKLAAVIDWLLTNRIVGAHDKIWVNRVRNLGQSELFSMIMT